jgi:hypothetical protein
MDCVVAERQRRGLNCVDSSVSPRTDQILDAGQIVFGVVFTDFVRVEGMGPERRRKN